MADDPGHAGAVAIAIAGINAVILINGGAAGALLAFYGEALSSGTASGLHVGPLRLALVALALGAGAGACCAILAYLSELAWMTTRGETGGFDVPWRIGAVVAAAASAGLFLIGIALAAYSFA